MDAFYASVEQYDHPELRGKPVAVGGSAARGVVAAASYEARKYGVFSAMPSTQAAKLCPNLLFVKPRFERYKEVSQVIRNIFNGYTDLVEPLSLDEAYLDVTQTKKGPPSATLIARLIKKEIKEKTGLTASAGISYNKFLAKTASDMDKPDGLFVILPNEAESFLMKLPIKKFHGIGKVTAEKMKMAGIFTGAELKMKTLQDLTLRYGKMGHYYYDIVRGVDERVVTPERETKSISAENTFHTDLIYQDQVFETLLPIASEVIRRCNTKHLYGKTATIKIKYADFELITRSRTTNQIIDTTDKIMSLVNELWHDDYLTDKGIRLLGIAISNFVKPQLTDKQMVIEF